MKGLGYFVFMLVGNYLAMPLGGVLLAVVSSSFAAPYIGRPLRFLLRGPAKLILAVKLFSWCVSASGLVCGYFAFAAIAGPPVSPFHLWAVAGASGIVFLNLSYEIVMVELYDVSTRLLQKLAVALPEERSATGPSLQVMTLPEEFTLGGVQKQWIGKPQTLAGRDLEANQAIFLMQLAGLDRARPHSQGLQRSGCIFAECRIQIMPV